MNLSYTLPKAEENIIAGVKLHTFREDRGGRWKPGMKIHHSYSFRSKGGYSCFLVNECKAVQPVLVLLRCLLNTKELKLYDVIFRIERRSISIEAEQMLILNDGFESRMHFIDWFFPANKKGVRKKTMWAGKIIHWTNLKY